MILKVTSAYHFIIEYGPAKVYFLESMPFTWNELNGKEKEDPEVLTAIAKNIIISSSEIYNSSCYLIEEGMHPLLHNIALTLDSELPDDVELEE